jgi:hypothetical protein
MGIGQRRLDERQQPTDVIPGRQFRHDAAVFGMHLHLAMQGVRQQPDGAVVHGRRGLVAGGFDAQHPHIR